LARTAVGGCGDCCAVSPAAAVRTAPIRRSTRVRECRIGRAALAVMRRVSVDPAGPTNSAVYLTEARLSAGWTCHVPRAGPPREPSTSRAHGGRWPPRQDVSWLHARDVSRPNDEIGELPASSDPAAACLTRATPHTSDGTQRRRGTQRADKGPAVGNGIVGTDRLGYHTPNQERPDVRSLLTGSNAGLFAYSVPR